MQPPVVFDVDGTLTSEHCTEEELETVKPNFVMLDIARALQETYPLVISTARPERYRKQTEKWLSNLEIYPKQVYMREEGRDKVTDPMIKFGHLQAIRKEFGDPVLWADDNPENINMLTKNFVPVIQVKQ